MTSVEPALAECNPPGADPSFRNAVPYAARVVVGRVIAVAPDPLNAPGAASYRFTLGVEHVLRGPAASQIGVYRVETGMCIRWLAAAEGDRIALALDVRAPDPSIATNTAAWITGGPPESVSYETLTFAQVVELAQVKPPDTSTDARHRAGDRPSPALAVLVAAAAAFILRVAGTGGVRGARTP